MKIFGMGILVFLIAVSIATVFNVVMHHFVPDQVINMFFISPYYAKTSPFFDSAWQAMGGIGRLFFYIGGLTGFAFIIFMVFYVCSRILKFRQAKREQVAA